MEMEDHAKFCMECGTKLEQSGASGGEQVHSLAGWKDKKNREKDAKMKQARMTEKERLNQIEQKMYDKQDEFQPLARKKKEGEEEEKEEE